MTFDLVRLFEHPWRFRTHIPSAIVTFGGNQDVGNVVLDVEWKPSATGSATQARLMLTWDVATLRPRFAEIDEELEIIRTRDEDQATRVEFAAVVVAVAVLSHVEPETRFTCRSNTGTRHDFYLNDTRDEMVEIAGRWEGGLPGLFEEKRAQSDLNPALRKRWVSVTVMRASPRNRTEGLHT